MQVPDGPGVGEQGGTEHGLPEVRTRTGMALGDPLPSGAVRRPFLSRVSCSGERLLGRDVGPEMIFPNSQPKRRVAARTGNKKPKSGPWCPSLFELCCFSCYFIFPHHLRQSLRDVGHVKVQYSA